MDEGALWTFGRRDERLTLRREETEDGFLLAVSENGRPRSFYFSDLHRLISFQSDMEAFLLRTGWSFIEFSPERRRGGDRRAFPRVSERRRWWTDGFRLVTSGRRRRDGGRDR